MSRDNILVVETLTRGQSANPLWHYVRKGRLTASHFGSILRACRRGSYPPSLFKSLLGCYKTSKAPSVQWGIQHESEAVTEYQKHYGCVDEVGLFLHPTGVLAATPDRLQGMDCLVEVKCPYAHRNSSISDLLQDPNFYLAINDEGSFTLKRNHPYYDQCQGQLFLSGRSQVYVFVWLLSGSVRVMLDRDEQWATTNIPVLLNFYFEHFLPKYADSVLTPVLQ